MLTRRQLADAIDEIDAEIRDYNVAKAGLYDTYRDDLAASGMSKADIKVEIAATKAAIAKRRALTGENAADVRDRDDLTDEILAEIMPSHVHVRVGERAHVHETEMRAVEAPTPRTVENREAGGPGEATAAATAETAVTNTAPGEATQSPVADGLGEHGLAARPAGDSGTTCTGQAGSVSGKAGGASNGVLPPAPPRTLAEIASGYQPTPVRRGPVEEEDIPVFLRRTA